MVGCVIVKEGSIIGEGYHRQYGGPHAEVEAVRSVARPELLEGAEVYVTLEPCAHHGKTPPCADMLMELPIKKVVIASRDPNPRVNGKGIDKLRAAGKEVEVGLLEKESQKLNRRFNKYHSGHHPYVVLKWAQTRDGFLARENYDSKWISGSTSRALVHRWRSEEDAILVGYRTAFHDNPRLNCRQYAGKHPIRVIWDPENQLPDHLFVKDGSIPSLIYTRNRSEKQENLEYVALENGSMDQLLQDLRSRKIQSVLVEGGASTLNEVLTKSLWDEARIFDSPVVFGKGIQAPVLPFETQELKKVDQDQLIVYHRQ
jgi:diaminohydroxyphosphoribosylaminopyrimidine deaminase/5-amino-6-(5-phosphoribosylamino)uracil reductase